MSTMEYPARKELLARCEKHNVEVFHVDRELKAVNTEMYPRVGWYYWCCFPGCMPEGDASRPNRLKESLKRGLVPNLFVEREYTLKVGPLPVRR